MCAHRGDKMRHWCRKRGMEAHNCVHKVMPCTQIEAHNCVHTNVCMCAQTKRLKSQKKGDLKRKEISKERKKDLSKARKFQKKEISKERTSQKI